jgi:hypothetical protein
VAFGAGLFVAAGAEGAIATSTSGNFWTQRVQNGIGGAYQRRIAYGGGLFVVVDDHPGSGTAVRTSADGITWTLNAGGGLQFVGNRAGLAYGGGLWVVVDRGNGSGSTVYYTSPDGITWTQRTLPVTADWRSIAYGDGAFVVVSSGTPSTTLTSTDGLTWTQRAFPTGSGWRAVAFGGDRFVALNSGSTIAATASPTLSAFSNIAAATSSSLALSGLAAADNGDQYRAVVSAANAASVTSNAATLTVT